MYTAQQEKPEVTVKFAGDSGDGMQVAGIQFSFESALEGYDIATYPDYPAEIRAPRGTLYGVSGFQVRFGSNKILTPGDYVDVLVAMNPAALRRTLHQLKPGGLIIADKESFEDKRDLRLAGYETNPLESKELTQNYKVIAIPITSLVRKALENSPLSVRERDRTRNMFVLGLVFWIFNRDLSIAERLIKEKFAKKHQIAEANLVVLRAGYHLGETIELGIPRIHVKRATLPPGVYRSITGNQALALGLLTASHLSGLPLFFSSYPITPASDVLHEMARYLSHKVTVIQTEDEIAAISSAIGAAFAGALAATATSGPGFSLMAEALGLAVMSELPLLVIDIQRAGPSTGMPTKPEQADLLQALFGRHGEAPLVVVAPAMPADCFDMVIEAARLATTHMVPVVILSDLYLANGAQPWRIPLLDALPRWTPHFWNHDKDYQPYLRDENMARWWVPAGTPHLQHVVGGLEKEHITGKVSYDPTNHQKMVHLRRQKVEKVAEDIPPQRLTGGTEDGQLAVVGWGSTYGVIASVVEELNREGYSVGHIHIRYLNPLPPNLSELLSRYQKIICVEMNEGQLAFYLQGKLCIKAERFNKVQGVPIGHQELKKALLNTLKSIES